MFQLARLRSERARVLALLSVSASLLLLVLLRGGVSVAQGHRGEAWPFACSPCADDGVPGFMAEICRAGTRLQPRASGRSVDTNIFIESLLRQSPYSSLSIHCLLVLSGRSRHRL
jgi:hypothetical protein